MGMLSEDLQYDILILNVINQIIVFLLKGPSYKSKSYASNINQINESNFEPIINSPKSQPKSAIKPKTIPKTYFGRNITSALLDKLERGFSILYLCQIFVDK